MKNISELQENYETADDILPIKYSKRKNKDDDEQNNDEDEDESSGRKTKKSKRSSNTDDSNEKQDSTEENDTKPEIRTTGEKKKGFSTLFDVTPALAELIQLPNPCRSSEVTQSIV